ncbi:MAG: hypothetical protein IKY83_05220 [Proteobacteria bacterium]|nr:hypothetical protein [Pseudomonadota bacterium]
MDLALAMSLLKQADQCGAEDAVLWVRKSKRRVERLDSKKISNELCTQQRCRLVVSVGRGSASAELGQGAAGIPGEAALSEIVKNLCQGARLCNVWGTTCQQVEDICREFDRHAVNAFEVSCRDSNAQCTHECFRESCLERDDPDYVGMLHRIAVQMQPLAHLLDWHGSMTLGWIEETLYSSAQTRTVSRFEAFLDQSIQLKGAQSQCALQFPRYSFARPAFGMTDHPFLIETSDVAQGFVESAKAAVSYGFDAHGLVLSGWAMAVLGHEAHHLNVDITRTGRLVYDVSQCMNVPENGGKCGNLAIKIALESNLTRDVLLSRVPDHSLYVDAPEYWIRRNGKFLDVRFLVVGSVIGGKIARYFEPVMLRFDLTKLWYYCLLAAKPYARISLKCGHSDAVSQAPYGFFDIDPKQGML